MKVNEVINEGVWSGIKTVGKGLGQIAGSAATGAVRALDRAAGGTGVVGTTAQQAEYKRKQEEKTRAYVDRVLGNISKRAMAEFSNVLQANRFDIQDLESLTPDIQGQMRTYLKAWTDHFFGDHNDRNKESLIKSELAILPVPQVLNVTTIQEYFDKAANIRKDIETNYLANTLAQQAAADQAKKAAAGAGKIGAQGAAGGLTSGVQVISSANPLVLRYRNRDYALTDDDRWVYMGSDKSPSPEMVQFLNKQLQQL